MPGEPDAWHGRGWKLIGSYRWGGADIAPPQFALYNVNNMKTGKVKLAVLLLVFAVSALAFFCVYLYPRPGDDNRQKEREIVNAASGSETLTSQPDWEEGTISNLDSTSSPGDLEIDINETKIDLYALYLSDPTKFIVSEDDPNKGNVIDSDTGTYWAAYIDDGVNAYWQADLGQIYHLSKTRTYSAVPEYLVTVSGSTDGFSFATLDSFYGFDGFRETIVDTDYRYLKVSYSGGGGGQDHIVFEEFEAYTEPDSGTHTSASTQIDGSANLESWDSFTPDQTVPTNTTLTYQFRSSADGSSWPDAWSTAEAYSGTPLDISSIAARRYFQVKSNFANSDGASTPTLSAYTVNYTRDDTCDNFDHINLTPSSADLETNGTTTFTATAVDSGDNPLAGITINWSADGGSVADGDYTAPDIAGDYTVTATSSCGGSAEATIHVTKPDEPEPEVCVPPNYFNCEACSPALTIIEPTKGSIHYTGDALNISWTPKESCGGIFYHAEQIRYRAKLSLNNGESYITLAEDLHDSNFPDEAAWLSIIQSGDWYNLIQPTTYSYIIPPDASFLTSDAKVKVYMYRADAYPHSYSPSTDATSEKFIIKTGSNPTTVECSNYQVRFTKPENLLGSIRAGVANAEPVYFLPLTNLDILSWPTFSYKLKASFFSKNTGSVIRNIDSKNFVLNPKNLAMVNPDGSLVINQEGFPKAQNFTLTATDPTCASSALLNISASAAVDDNPIPTDSNYIDVLVPDGGERWRLNNDYEIKWKLEEEDLRVVLYDIYLSLDSGESYPYTVIKNLPDDGTLTHSYHIPNNKELLTDKAKIKVVGKNQEKQALLVGSSGEDFTIYQSLLGAVVKIVEDNITALLIILMTATAVASMALLLTPLLSNQLTLSTIPEIFWGIIAKGKSKRKRWGQVYEATSGMPIPNTRLELISTLDNRVVETTISNQEGRFGFVTPKGRYIIKTTKFGFESVNHQESLSRDTLALRDNYLGGEISIEGEGDKIIKVNIPLISSKESPRFVTIAKGFNLIQNFLIIVNWPLLLFGTLISVIALYLTPSILNLLILVLYIPLWAYEFYLMFEPRSFGNVEREDNHIPIDLALVRVLDQESKRLIRSVVSNQRGRYSLLLPKGNYHQYAQKAGYLRSREKSIYLEQGINSVHTNFSLKSRGSNFAQTG
jgi:hypothetical protein